MRSTELAAYRHAAHRTLFQRCHNPRCGLLWGQPYLRNDGISGALRTKTQTRAHIAWSSCRPHVRAFSSHAFQESTIYALSSAPGRAAIAVIRVSGPACLDIYRKLCPGREDPQPRHAAVRTLYEPLVAPTRDSILDSSALILYFPAPATATGEDVLELHVHGGPAIVKAVLAAISKCGTGVTGRIRYAEPGEFTRRAFMNNRLDLTQVEALGDTLSADTEQQRRLSVRGTTSELAKHYETWRQQLLYARGELEALIDFSEDQHFDEGPTELCVSVASQVQALRRTLQIHSQNAVRGEMLRHGIGISLLGAPNAGKSSLLNRIVGREAAIVSQEAGTTRDIVEIGLDVDGYLCRFGDTAGLRQAVTEAVEGGKSREVINQVEIEGMRRAKERAADSDLVIVVFSIEMLDDRPVLDIDAEVCTFASSLLQKNANVIVVVNKIDLLGNADSQQQVTNEVLDQLPGLHGEDIQLISCKTANSSTSNPPPQSSDPGGIQTFLQGLVKRFERLTAAATLGDADSSVWQESLGASERHRLLLDSCIKALDTFLTEVAGEDEEQAEPDIVLAAEHLRAAADCLAKITGKGEAGDVEEVLGVVFEKFCVGK